MRLKLLEIRQKNNLSQYQLAKKMRTSRSYISELENGKNVPSIRIICKLCEALNCTPNDLINCEGGKDE